MSENPMNYEYRVIIDIPEDQWWDAQELVDGEVFLTPGEAETRRGEMDLSRYPKGTTTYVEVRSFTDWGRL